MRSDCKSDRTEGSYEGRLKVEKRTAQSVREVVPSSLAAAGDDIGSGRCLPSSQVPAPLFGGDVDAERIIYDLLGEMFSCCHSFENDPPSH